MEKEFVNVYCYQIDVKLKEDNYVDINIKRSVEISIDEGHFYQPYEMINGIIQKKALWIPKGELDNLRNGHNMFFSLRDNYTDSEIITKYLRYINYEVEKYETRFNQAKTVQKALEKKVHNND